MSPMLIIFVCTAALGAIMAIAALVRQLLSSRDIKLNEAAQNKALNMQVEELTKMRTQLQNSKRFDAHYQILGDNKEQIRQLDSQIDTLLYKKLKLIEMYAQATVEESTTIIDKKEISLERKAACDLLKKDIDEKIALYDTEIKALQDQRAKLWDSHMDFEKQLLDEEKSRNLSLNSLYAEHTILLEKVYLRHISSLESVNVKAIEAGSISFKDMIASPFKLLAQFFTGGIPKISLVQNRMEQNHRYEVDRMEHYLNRNPRHEFAENPRSAEEQEENNQKSPNYSF